ncbi:AraC family transcriptional regulator [Cereibacter sphaeroides]|nr:AraC family transcriptional regulator [Cereibacter sphaeroides]
MFLPSMQAFIEDIRAVADVRWLSWPGAMADHWQASGQKGGHGFYVSPDPRMVVFLEPAPPIGLSACAEQPGHARLAYVPAGVPIWSHMHADGNFSHLDLHFSLAALVPDRAEQATLPQAPVLLDSHPGIEPLAALILSEITAQRCDPLLLDALVKAMLGYFRQAGSAAPSSPCATCPNARGFTLRQQRQVLRVIDENLHRRITIAELAEAAGLSESWFARAFRAALGETPARIIARKRIDRAKVMLRDTEDPLVEIAVATGFSDQAHFTRVFRSQTGTTPAAWREQMLAA